MPTVFYKPIGRCIYGMGEGHEGPFKMEHIVPLSLGGEWELPDASCGNCEKVTSAFERTVARGSYLQLRTTEGYPTRRPKGRPKAFPVELSFADGTTKQDEIPADECPAFYIALQLPKPGILTGAPLTDSNPEMQALACGDPDALGAAFRKHFPHAETVTLAATTDFRDFARTLAKIAHGFLVAMIGFDGYEAYLPDLILGTNPHLSNFVGGWPHPMVCRIGLPTDGFCLDVLEDGKIICMIQLFHGRFPLYAVVAGRVTDSTIFWAAAQSERIDPKTVPGPFVPFWEAPLAAKPRLTPGSDGDG